MNLPSFRIRAFQPADQPAVTRILQLSPQAAPWSPEALHQFLEGRETPGRLFLVCELNGRVTGFLMGRQVADEAEILNVAMLPEHRRTGQARALLANALAEFRDRGALSVFLEVRESNAAAIAFYETHGFSVTARRPAYYRDPEEAALCMTRKLAGVPN